MPRSDLSGSCPAPRDARRAAPTTITGGKLSLDRTDFELLALTDPTLNLVPEAWSPDGERIAFEGWDDSDSSRTGVYTARASDLGGLVRVTSSGGRPHDIALDYSPDGSQLVFYRSVRAEPHFPIDIGGSLWVVNVDGSNPIASGLPERLRGGGLDGLPMDRRSCSPPSGYNPRGALWTVRPDGSGLTTVFEDEEGRFASGPTWSPDGGQILFALNPTNDWFIHEPNGLYVIDADGSDLTLVIGGSDFKSSPEWWR